MQKFKDTGLIFVAVLLLLPLNVFSQNNEQKYLNITSIKGIENPVVTCVYKDSDGASVLVISDELENELILNGSITYSDYKGYEDFELANKKIERARMVILNNVTIGGYTLNNVMAAIVEDGSLLCGNSLLNKFSKWEIDSKNKCLVVYK